MKDAFYVQAAARAYAATLPESDETPHGAISLDEAARQYQALIAEGTSR